MNHSIHNKATVRFCVSLLLIEAINSTGFGLALDSCGDGEKNGVPLIVKHDRVIHISDYSLHQRPPESIYIFQICSLDCLGEICAARQSLLCSMASTFAAFTTFIGFPELCLWNLWKTEAVSFIVDDCMVDKVSQTRMCHVVTVAFLMPYKDHGIRTTRHTSLDLKYSWISVWIAPACNCWPSFFWKVKYYN